MSVQQKSVLVSLSSSLHTSVDVWASWDACLCWHVVLCSFLNEQSHQIRRATCRCLAPEKWGSYNRTYTRDVWYCVGMYQPGVVLIGWESNVQHKNVYIVQSVCLSVCLSACLSLYLPVCQYVYFKHQTKKKGLQAT